MVRDDDAMLLVQARQSTTGAVLMFGPFHDRCTCQSGRDYNGSEYGPCIFCEDAPFREMLEAHAEPEQIELEELEDWFDELRA